MPYPLPPSLCDFCFYRGLVGSLPQIGVTYFVGPSNLEDASQTRVDKCLDPVYCGNSHPPCLGTIEKYSLDVGVKNPDFGACCYSFGLPDVSKLHEC